MQKDTIGMFPMLDFARLALGYLRDFAFIRAPTFPWRSSFLYGTGTGSSSMHKTGPATVLHASLLGHASNGPRVGPVLLDARSRLACSEEASQVAARPLGLGSFMMRCPPSSSAMA